MLQEAEENTRCKSVKFLQGCGNIIGTQVKIAAEGTFRKLLLDEHRMMKYLFDNFSETVTAWIMNDFFNHILL